MPFGLLDRFTMEDRLDTNSIDLDVSIVIDPSEQSFPHRPLHERGGLRDDAFEQSIKLNNVYQGNTVDSAELSTEAFPVFNPTIDDEIPFEPDQGTTKDEAEFSSHIREPATNGASQNVKSGQSEQPNAFPDLNKTALPRRQRGNSNDRSRMRAEEICQENYNFVRCCF